MNRFTTLLLAPLGVLLGISVALAQDGAPRFSPVEIIACSFVGNNDMSDLTPIIADFNKWADGRGVENYSAIMAVPFFRSADTAFDFLWVGMYADGAALGSGLNSWVNQSGNLPDRFAQVANCPTRMGLAALTLKAASGESDGVEDGGKFILEFSNCTVHENRTGPEAADAIREWIDYLTANGSRSSHSLLVPGPGESADATYTFKWLKSHSSYVSLGKEFELNINNGGIGRRNELFGRVMSCDSPRIYNSWFLREARG
jgi:hypothetical protein